MNLLIFRILLESYVEKEYRSTLNPQCLEMLGKWQVFNVC